MKEGGGIGHRPLFRRIRSVSIVWRSLRLSRWSGRISPENRRI